MNVPAKRPFQIVQVNLQADRGGDGRIVSDLHHQYRALGYSTSLMLGRGAVPEGGIPLRPDAYRSRWARAWLGSAATSAPPSLDRSGLAKLKRWIAEPRRRWRIRSGFEDFDFPTTVPAIAQVIREGPSILHFHNLHGGYFDLRALPVLNALAPVVLTLHDQWTFTGHCAHSFECERWTLGCGECPDLTIYPGIPRDRTAENFIAKREIFSHARLHLAAPSRWLMERAERSLLSTAIVEKKVIPNGVDTRIFHPGDAVVERARLGLPVESRIILCANKVARSSHWSNEELFLSTLRYLAQEGPSDITLVLLGSERGFDDRMEGIRVIHRPYEQVVETVAGYYRASDIYLHPAGAGTFPTTVLESLACGVPVVATDVGGIPEQVRSLVAAKEASGSPRTLATGILVDPQDRTGLGRAIERLMLDSELRTSLGENGARTAMTQFSITVQAQRYLDWYQEILSDRPRSAVSPARRSASQIPDPPR
jgi:glycosyltransferase involved in cell wall biosynthesis